MSKTNLPPKQEIFDRAKKVKCGCPCHGSTQNKHSILPLDNAKLKKTKLSFTVHVLPDDIDDEVFVRIGERLAQSINTHFEG